ncbi:MAG: hypothetical protein ACYCPT_11940, partial [Acidimicrobiales bacterium]
MKTDIHTIFIRSDYDRTADFDIIHFILDCGIPYRDYITIKNYNNFIQNIEFLMHNYSIILIDTPYRSYSADDYKSMTNTIDATHAELENNICFIIILSKYTTDFPLLPKTYGIFNIKQNPDVATPITYTSSQRVKRDPVAHMRKNFYNPQFGGTLCDYIIKHTYNICLSNDILTAP